MAMRTEQRTDLALEARELRGPLGEDPGALPGVEFRETREEGFPLSLLRVLDEQGEKELCKPIGSYITLELGALLRREEDAFARGSELLSRHIRALLHLCGEERLLIVGLGNPNITPDALGPQTVDYLLVTRHLKKQLPEEFQGFREVSALKAGVLGTTGLEAAETVSALVGLLRPDGLILIDALASCRMDRLCRTVQLTDTGITPGSGVGNHRSPLTRETLGVPVLAIGMPTVVRGTVLAEELLSRAGLSLPESAAREEAGRMIFTPRDIDSRIHDAAKLLGYSINMALHGLTLSEVDLFL